MRWYNIFFIIMTLVTCFALYQMKYDTRDLHKKVAEIESQIAQEEDAIKVLRAEWSLLTQPARIEALSDKFLKLNQLATDQIWQEKALSKLPEEKTISVQDANKLDQLIERSLFTSSIKEDAN